jgi:hypothetical protein
VGLRSLLRLAVVLALSRQIWATVQAWRLPRLRCLFSSCKDDHRPIKEDIIIPTQRQDSEVQEVDSGRTSGAGVGSVMGGGEREEGEVTTAVVVGEGEEVRLQRPRCSRSRK